MSASNGAKQYLYVVRHEKAWNGTPGQQAGQQFYLVLADRDPTKEELVALLKLDLHWKDTLESQRYDIDALPTLPPKP